MANNQDNKAQSFGTFVFDEVTDPLNVEIPGNVPLSTLTRIPHAFTITTDSYISLCSLLYDACCVTFAEFSDHIPESAFQLYAVLLLWQRFGRILFSNKRCPSDHFDELSYLVNYGNVKHLMPEPLMRYLNGIGHFRDPYGCDRQFQLPVLPICEKIGGTSFTFGKVNSKTHGFYEAFPAPGIAILRMLADIRYTKEPCKKNLIWDLPEELQPDVAESHVESNKPTKNLLGWAPAQRLTSKQLELFEELEIDSNFMPDNYSTLNETANILRKRLQDLLCAEFVENDWWSSSSLSPSMGSVVQGMAVEIRNEFSTFNPSAMYCEGNILTCSSYNVNDTLRKIAVVSGYRMAKEPISSRQCWSCYDFNEYKNVPESWIRTRNIIYSYGNVGGLNEKIYSSGYIAKRIGQNEYLRHLLGLGSSWNMYL